MSDFSVIDTGWFLSQKLKIVNATLPSLGSLKMRYFSPI